MEETKGINIWLDDMRDAPNGWIHLHNIEEVEKLVGLMLQKENFYINEMSFDFHLNHPKQGVDVMKYLVGLCKQHKTKRFWPKIIHYHSNDPNGVKIMQEFAAVAEKEIL